MSSTDLDIGCPNMGEKDKAHRRMLLFSFQMQRHAKIARMQSRISKIKQLAKEYFALEHGTLIEKHLELLRIFDIRGPKCTEHPHRMCRVYISRKALKHFVEERKAAFLVRHTEAEALAAIYFGIDMIPDTIMDFDRHEHEPKECPPKHFYSKNYSHQGRPFLRILVEQKDNTLEIRSIHFETRDRR